MPAHIPAHGQLTRERAKISLYLEHYGEPEAQQLPDWPEDAILQRCIVIPAYNEQPHFLQTTLSKLHPADQHETLIIVIINRPTHDTDITPSHALFDCLYAQSTAMRQSNNLSLLQHNNGYLLVVDRFSDNNTIPSKHGVGLARKIGADIACELYVTGKLKSPWLYSTDADAIVAQHYFSQEKNADGSAAQIFNFYHTAHDSDQPHHLAVKNATQLVENAIKYYADALSWAGSPYGFCTLGSTLAVNLYHYALVRGFPKRAAGEDFYLLNKIAKVGNILHCKDIIVTIQPRLSSRVPFGTGPAVADILRLESTQAYCYYNPAIFVKLKQLIALVTKKNKAIVDISNIDDIPLQHALMEQNINQFLLHGKTHCKQSKDWLTHFHHWFDAFKTLKFIHYLQATRYPKIPLEECLKQFTKLKNDIDD